MNLMTQSFSLYPSLHHKSLHSLLSNHSHSNRRKLHFFHHLKNQSLFRLKMNMELLTHNGSLHSNRLKTRRSLLILSIKSKFHYRKDQMSIIPLRETHLYPMGVPSKQLHLLGLSLINTIQIQYRIHLKQ